MDEAARTTEPHPYTPDDYSDCATCGRLWIADVHTNYPGRDQ